MIHIKGDFTNKNELTIKFQASTQVFFDPNKLNDFISNELLQLHSTTVTFDALIHDTLTVLFACTIIFPKMLSTMH